LVHAVEGYLLGCVKYSDLTGEAALMRATSTDNLIDLLQAEEPCVKHGFTKSSRWNGVVRPKGIVISILGHDCFGPVTTMKLDYPYETASADEGATVVPHPYQPVAHHSPTRALKVHWRIWPWFVPCGLIALSGRSQTSLNQLGEGTGHQLIGVEMCKSKFVHMFANAVSDPAASEVMGKDS
jgi:hypothetical protein